ncbi:MAG TPA: hypothetical protein VGQ86_04585, partial [Candidatus Limnocylindria bacterium]|nr:hypothetical protein [Candidatus Limnocylindria bacterium]
DVLLGLQCGSGETGPLRAGPQSVTEILMSMDEELPRTGSGRDPDVRKALADIDRLVRENPPTS